MLNYRSCAFIGVSYSRPLSCREYLGVVSQRVLYNTQQSCDNSFDIVSSFIQLITLTKA